MGQASVQRMVCETTQAIYAKLPLRWATKQAYHKLHQQMGGAGGLGPWLSREAGRTDGRTCRVKHRDGHSNQHTTL